MNKKATEDQFNELHNLVTKEFLSRIKAGKATTQDLKAACDWLKANDICRAPVTLCQNLHRLCQLLIQN